MTEVIKDGLPVYPEKLEVERSEPRSVFWTDAEADLVVGFLNGVEGREDGGGGWASVLATETKISEEDKMEVEKLIQETNAIKPQDSTSNDEVMTGDKSEYEWMTKEATRSVLSQIERSLRSVGMFSNLDYRRRAVSGKIREKRSFGLETNMSGYKHKSKSPIKDSSGNYVLADKVEGGYLRHEEGGPRVLSQILLPMFNSEKPMKWRRFVRGMAHEVAHEIRVWANRCLWENIEWSDKLPRRGNVAAYGPQVGSNLTGSESVGMLSGIIAQKMWEVSGKVPTIEEVLPLVAAKAAKRLEGGEAEDRYDVASLALYDHLKQICDRGGGGKSALDFLSMGICGYVTYEHLPDLIHAGVIDQTVFAKSKIVVQEVFELMCGVGYTGNMADDRTLTVRGETGVSLGDPLDWLGDETKRLVQEKKDGFAFWQAKITFANGESTRVAFSGDSESDPEGADGHTIYVEKPKLLSRFEGLEYDGSKKAWGLGNTDGRIFLVGGEVEKGGKGEYSLEDGDSWEPPDSESPGFNSSVDSDGAEVEIRSLINKQTNKDGVKVEWLAPA
ncbi:hypothetical protein HYU91_01175 [Candidatus Collierbacteria bacterium]|nr:hypothetical protein [Candidatus Collierbacteria bacterium]